MDAILECRPAACAVAVSRDRIILASSYTGFCPTEAREYKIFGYKGKQVRDNIHSSDVARFMEAFINAPRTGEVYNVGGGKANSCSILEAFEIVEKFTDRPQVYTYVDNNRIGDHICYYSDLGKMKRHYPSWRVVISLDETIRQIVDGWEQRISRPGRAPQRLEDQEVVSSLNNNGKNR
jgi:CDP-paratose 2-epimerase